MLRGHHLPHPRLPHSQRRRHRVLTHRLLALGLSRRDWSGTAFSGEGIQVVITVWAVGGRAGAAAADGLGVPALRVGGVLPSVS